MTILSPQQIAELMTIISNYHLLFIARNVGAEMLTEDEKQTLVLHGVKPEDLAQISKVEEAFAFGMIAQAIGDKRAKDMKYKEFKKFLESGKALPYTAAEKFAIQSLKGRMSTDIRNQMNRIQVDFKNTLSEVEQHRRKQYIKDIKEGAEKVLLDRGSAKDLASYLGNKTGDWARDFDRIADYVMHTALDSGIAMQIEKEHGADALVWKEVYMGACKHCVSAYLTNGLGSEPKLFKLSELISNGTNIGRKTAEMKPVVGAHHPWCRCQLRHKKPDRLWNPKEQDYTTVLRNSQGVKRTGKSVIRVST